LEFLIPKGVILPLVLGKLEVQNQGDNNYQDHNNGAENPLVLVHPCWYVRQNFLALVYVIIHSMMLHEGTQPSVVEVRI